MARADREAVLRGVNARFDETGDDDAVIAALGSPTFAAVSVLRGYTPPERDEGEYEDDYEYAEPEPEEYAPPAEPEDPLLSRSTRRTDLPSAPPSASRSRSPNTSPTLHAGEVRARGERPSVRDELRSIKATLRQRESVTPRPKTPIRIHRGGQAR